METNPEGLDRASSTKVAFTEGSKELSNAIESDFHSLIDYISEYKANYISTPFKGTCLRITKDSKSFVFASREGRIAKCDIDKKQLMLDEKIEEGSVWCLDITNDDSYVYTGGVDGVIKKFDVNTLTREAVFEGHTGEINSIALSSDNLFLYSCSDDTTVRKWDINNNTQQVLYSHIGYVYNMDLSFDNLNLASCSSSGEVKVYDLASESERFYTKLEGEMWCIKISNRNTYLIAGDNLALIYIWSFSDLSLLRKMPGHLDRVRCLSISSDEKFLVSGGIDNLIKVWNLEVLQDEITIYGHSDWVKSIIISNDLQSIYTMGDDCKIRISKVPFFENHRNIPTKATIESYLFNKKDKVLYALNRSKQILQIKGNSSEVIANLNGSVLSWFITDHGKKVAVVYSPRFSVELNVIFVDLYGSKNINQLYYKTDSIVTCAAISEDGVYLVTGESYRITIYNLKNGQTQIFRSYTYKVTSLAMDQHQLFAGDEYGIIKCYHNESNFNEIGQFTDESHGLITSIHPLTPRGLLFSCSNTGKILIWSLKKLLLIYIIPIDYYIKNIYFSSNNLNFFVNFENKIMIFNVENISRCGLITLPSNNEAIGYGNDEKDIHISFTEYYKVLENPLKTSKISFYGNNKESYKFIEYLLKIFNEEAPRHVPEMDNWLIEPYHMNALHIYSYYNLPKHLESSIKAGGCFIPSQKSYTPLSISIEKKFLDCIDSIIEGLKAQATGDPMSLYYVSSSLPVLNKTSYNKLHELYNISFRHNIMPNMPKFCEDSVALPVLKKSDNFFIQPADFIDQYKYKYQELPIEFLQSFVTVNIELGSAASLKFMESLIECKNSEVYCTSFIKIILQEKWKVVRWILLVEAFVYVLYLGIISFYILNTSYENSLVALFTISILLFFYELFQFIAAKGFSFPSFQNCIELTRFITFTLYFVFKTLGLYEDFQKPILLVFVISAFVKGLSYFKIFEKTRWVVKMISSTFNQVWPIVFVVGYTIGCLEILYLCFEQHPDLIKGYELENNEEFELEWMMFLFVLVINPIIVLNLYLTVIGHTFEKSINEKSIIDGQEIAKMIYEGEVLLFCNRKRNKSSFIHVLREQSLEIQSRNTSGERISRISDTLNAIETSSIKNSTEIAGLKLYIQSKSTEIDEISLSIINNIRPKN